MRDHITLRYKVTVRLPKFAIAATELVLILPATLFMTALFVRNLQPLQYEPARSAQQIVAWFAVRPHLGLWVLLMALPFTALITGCLALSHRWNDDAGLRQDAGHAFGLLRPHLATLLITAATCTAAGILAIVALHVLTN